MQNVLKPFGARDIGLLSGRFKTARAQLTFIYVFVLGAVLLLSSTIIYSAFSMRLEHRFRGFPPRQMMIQKDDEVLPPRQQDVLDDFTNALLLVNGALLVLTGMFSYWFAGVTLRPIQVSYNRQRQFLGDASHELRTPLTILRTDFENALGVKTVSAQEREDLTSHLEEVDRMSKIVGDLLLLSRLDENAEAVEGQTSIDLSEFVEKSVARLEGIAQKQDVSLTFHPSAKKIEVLTQESLLSRALENVLKNAIMYNKSKGSVAVTVEAEREYAKIIVKDTGVGIPEADIEKIFDRFYRVDVSRSRQTGGSGLGLSIVYTIMQRLQGMIHVSSALGEGTTVVLGLRSARSS